MDVRVTLEAIKAASRGAAEQAQLVFADESLVALLLPAEVGWYLQLGLDPCEGEGELFPTTEAATNWVRARMAST